MHIMLNWLKEYNAVLMVALTAIYVVATILILRANNETTKATLVQAEAAQKQIIEAERQLEIAQVQVKGMDNQLKEAQKMRQATLEIQEQNVKLQLFEKRYKIYIQLNAWLEGIENAFLDEKMQYSFTGVEMQYCEKMRLFYKFIYKSIDKGSSRIEQRKLDILYRPIGPGKKININMDEITEGMEIIMKYLRYVKEEKEVIIAGQFCFRDINYKTVEKFTDAFYDLAEWVGYHKEEDKDEECKKLIEELKTYIMLIKEEDVLGKMKSQLLLV